jgi:hypothetical protein
MDKGRAGSPRAGCLSLAELGVLLLRHVSTLRSKSNMFFGPGGHREPRGCDIRVGGDLREKSDTYRKEWR